MRNFSGEIFNSFSSLLLVMADEFVRVSVPMLMDYVMRVFTALDVPERDAHITADVLVLSDRRGIASHGVARLERYVKGIREGTILPVTRMELIRETPVTALFSANNGLGQVAGHYGMKVAIEKAKRSGVGLVAVRESNHYGIAGYYSMMAVEHGFIGISTTNSAPLVVPTHGREAVIGTDPISVAVPTKKRLPFVVDMATSTVPRGKLEVYERRGESIPEVWATDAKGKPTTNPGEVLENLIARRGGGLLPLGGAEELTGGHKGYGLAMMVEIITGVLSGGAFATQVYGHKEKGANVCHFFGAIDVNAFIPENEFRKRMDTLLEIVSGSQLAHDKERIFIHGEKEYEMMEANKETVPLYHKVIESINRIGVELGLERML